ncbi:hypothetical protein INT44_007574 [Umbelopsis vinacea]|uniref:Oxidase FUB9 n=1 Tax=Umbelopsis vinacea TaxID=44442 RepID=A0A8H7PKX2_9FUNG|nr:hypothetical protein INT44_007574 [Umbelopsis vinacea]KAI9288004.1 Hydroxyacid oxidase 2 [Umbelopsis sp. AD052]
MSSAPVCLDDFEKLARLSLPASVFGYYFSGADAESTLQRNKDAYDSLLIRPRILVDVEKVTTETTILGHKINSPVCVAPTAFHGMANDEAEKATARACASLKTCYTMATYSNTSMEDTYAAAKQKSRKQDPLHWFQLYVEQDREATKQLVQRCERAGYKALVITVDRPRLGRRLADLRHAFKLPKHLSLANFIADETRSGAGAYAGGAIDASLNWKDIEWFKSITKLPIVIKGIFRGEDAKLAVKHGVDGIIVSNHGGRQLDGCPATLEVLPEIVDAVKGSKVEVYVDGGIRKGTDVFKALALGARAVFLGRPIVYGLAYQGEEGVRSVLSLINYEFRLAMALAGCTSTDKITPDYIIPAEEISLARSYAKYHSKRIAPKL